jgi:hypothetical protein
LSRGSGVSQGQALDHDLHAQVGHVPAAVGDDVVEQHLQVGVDRVVPVLLLVEVLGEDLDVAGLVHHLGGRVVLGVDPRHGLDDLGRAQQGALLTVHELAQRPVVGLDGEADPLVLGPLLERGAGDVLLELGELHALEGGVLLEVDLGVPGEVGLAVPLRALGLLVELVERRPGALLVVPREDGVGVVLDRVDDLVHVGVADGEDRLEVVDLVPTDQLTVAGVLVKRHCEPPRAFGLGLPCVDNDHYPRPRRPSEEIGV